jgi:hypothetical protein
VNQDEGRDALYDEKYQKEVNDFGLHTCEAFYLGNKNSNEALGRLFHTFLTLKLVSLSYL